VIQRILRHSNVSTTQSFYILPVGDDVRNAMAKLEAESDAQRHPDTIRTLNNGSRPQAPSVN
jgi:hypothetical protein